MYKIYNYFIFIIIFLTLLPSLNLYNSDQICSVNFIYVSSNDDGSETDAEDSSNYDGSETDAEDSSNYDGSETDAEDSSSDDGSETDEQKTVAVMMGQKQMQKTVAMMMGQKQMQKTVAMTEENNDVSEADSKSFFRNNIFGFSTEESPSDDDNEPKLTEHASKSDNTHEFRAPLKSLHSPTDRDVSYPMKRGRFLSTILVLIQIRNW